MSKINLNNYEAFMLDYLEGNLSQQDILALKAFAVLHPELELNFEEELVTLENENEVFEGKQHLKASFSDELVIGYLENVLEGAEKEQAEELAKNNAVFKQELALYKKTVVIADSDIIFENKEKLKRRGVIVFFPQTNYVRVAAALLLLLGLWFTVSRVMNTSTNSATKDVELAKKEIAPVQTSTVSNSMADEKQELMSDTTENLVAKNTNVNNINVNNKDEKQITTATVGVNVPEQKEEPQLADRIPIKEVPNMMIDSNVTQLANSNSEKLVPKYIIEEGVDDEQLATRPKSKLWNFASGIFKGLNRRGIENVNGSDNNNEIFIGALTISKPN